MNGAAIVGMGVVSPMGANLDETFEALIAGKNAITTISRFDASTFPVRIAAQGPDVPGADGRANVIGRAWLAAALDEALFGLDLDGIAKERRGIYLGAEAARPALRDVIRGLDGDPPGRSELEALAPWAPLRQVADRVGARGPAAVLSTACTSSGQAVGEAMLAIRRGEVDVAVAVGVDVLVHPLMVAGFSRLGALSTRNDDPASASRPFDLDRDGFVLGEGAGALVLVRPELAGVVGPLLGWIRGYGGSSNAWRITDSPADGRGAAAAMAAALTDGGATPADLAWIHAHGTSTKQNDISESRGILTVLGGAVRDVPCSSSKSMMGHLVAACGVVGTAVAARALSARMAPGTRNLTKPDPACPVRHMTCAEAIRPGAALVNAFGFGGVNASILVHGP